MARSAPSPELRSQAPTPFTVPSPPTATTLPGGAPGGDQRGRSPSATQAASADSPISARYLFTSAAVALPRRDSGLWTKRMRVSGLGSPPRSFYNPSHVRLDGKWPRHPSHAGDAGSPPAGREAGPAL